MEHMSVNSKYFDTEKCKKLSLEEFSLPELRLLLNKQTKLFGNPQILKCLPDRGEKIKQYISSIEQAIAVRENYEAAIQAMSGLKIEETHASVSSPLVSSPLASPTKSARVLSNNIDGDKLEKVKSKIASRPVPRSTQLLSRVEEQQVAERDRERQGRTNREAEIKLGDFLGMFKVGNVKVTSDLEEAGDNIDIQDIRLRDNLIEDSDTDSEVSDQSKNSSGEGNGEIGEGISLLEESFYGSTQ